MDQHRQLALIPEKLECYEHRELGLLSHFHSLHEQVKSLVNEVRVDIKEINRHLWGNGRAGLLMRLDRLERAQRGRQAQTPRKNGHPRGMPSFL